jgi:ribosome-associated heat shock protein Hsp15
MKNDERGDRVPGDRAALASTRLDVWLDVACLFRTRSEAQRACRGGKVHVNGQAAKPHREIRAGDALEISRPLGRRQLVVIRGLAGRHVPKALARELYEDRTPPLSPEEVELRHLARLARAFGGRADAGTPDRRQRRERRRMRGKS